jgi:hypothetical protein
MKARPMKRYSSIAIRVVLAVAIGLLPSLQLMAETTIQMHRIQVSEKDSSGWHPARSTNGRFSVLLPLPFNDFSASGDDSSEVLRSEVLGGKSTEGIMFSATRIYYVRGELAEKYFSNFKSGKVFSGAQTRAIRFKNHDAVDIEVSTSTSSSRQRAVLLNGSMILLIVEWPREYESIVKDIAGTFLDSLEID